jgi:predicted RNA-binding Zn ribbon-like protein
VTNSLTQAVPERLAQLAAFINTLDIEDRIDRISTPETLRAWLREQGLAANGVHVRTPDVGRAQHLREALRDVAEGNAGHGSGAAERLDAIAATLPLRLRFRPDAQLEADRGGIDAAFTTLLGSVYGAMQDGTWPRLKACRNPECRWAYYDTSRNRSGRWCSMAICGNRMKGRAFRKRQRASAPA